MRDDELIKQALADSLAIADSYSRNKEHLIAALRQAGLDHSWLEGWDRKFDRIRKATEKQTQIGHEDAQNGKE